MNSKLREIDRMVIPKKHILKNIKYVYNQLPSIPSFEIVSFGPSTPNDQRIEPKKTTITGLKLQRASTNASQGLWLTKLALWTTQKMGGKINILEIGTCVGISGMYLLSGMSQLHGGRLISFEGDPTLANLAQKRMNEFIAKNQLTNVEFEIIIGSFDKTLKKYFDADSDILHLAFIDGNHRQEATLQYHEAVRNKIHKNGVIVHDDINWSPGMAQAWVHIQQVEGIGKTAELYLGNRASRGIVFLDAAPNSRVEIAHLDGWLERLARRVKFAIK